MQYKLEHSADQKRAQIRKENISKRRQNNSEFAHVSEHENGTLQKRILDQANIEATADIDSGYNSKQEVSAFEDLAQKFIDNSSA